MKTIPMMRWHIAEQDRAAVGALARELGVPRVVAQLLRARGVTSPEAGRAFLNPSTVELSDPFLLTDMDRAVDRLTRARNAGEHVQIFGDYDVDGMSGTALLSQSLNRFGIHHCTRAMPSRLRDGYGLNAERVMEANSQGVSVIVTVDNGIKAHEAARTARECGIDLIVTDHHTIEDDLPPAVAVINPKRDDPASPFADASGAAVALKLGMALNGEPGGFGLAALGIVADIVPLQRENRVLVARGLEELSRNAPPGITALARRASVRLEELRAENIAFQLGPRLNACGRIGDGHSSLDLLLTECPKEAARLAEELHAANEERRRIEQLIHDDATAQIEPVFDPEQRTIVAAGRDWHPGVVGIVAARLQQQYTRPVVLIALNGKGMGRASARSSPDFDIMIAMGACGHLLERFGGHRAAAGMSIREENIPEFARIFEETARAHIPPGERTPELKVDAQVSLAEIDGQLIRALDRLEPFGAANPAPVFCVCGVEALPHSVRELKGGHLRLVARDDRAALTCIGFNMADCIPAISPGGLIDLAFTPKLNTWRGETTIQLQLKDLRPAQPLS